MQAIWSNPYGFIYLFTYVFIYYLGSWQSLVAKCLENGSVNILKNFYCVPVKKSRGFRMTWGWANNDKFHISSTPLQYQE